MRLFCRKPAKTRHGSTTKLKRNNAPTAARPASTTVADLQDRVSTLTRELAEAREQQAELLWYLQRRDILLHGSGRDAMNLSRRTFLHLAAGAAALPAVSHIATAETYPSHPVTIIVPVPPGGVADPIARILADHLTVTFGQPVVVENVTGAGGSIGVGRAARAAPDGYTVSIGNWLSHVGASAVYPVPSRIFRATTSEDRP